jgi:hypothetical protein
MASTRSWPRAGRSTPKPARESTPRHGPRRDLGPGFRAGRRGDAGRAPRSPSAVRRSPAGSVATSGHSPSGAGRRLRSPGSGALRASAPPRLRCPAGNGSARHARPGRPRHTRRGPAPGIHRDRRRAGPRRARDPGCSSPRPSSSRAGRPCGHIPMSSVNDMLRPPYLDPIHSLPRGFAGPDRQPRPASIAGATGASRRLSSIACGAAAGRRSAGRGPPSPRRSRRGAARRGDQVDRVGGMGRGDPGGLRGGDDRCPICRRGRSAHGTPRG